MVENHTYHDVYYANKCYHQILNELNPKQAEGLILVHVNFLMYNSK